jgi:membrane protein required for colicin V production
MSLQILDFILLGIMAVSGLLALARGFTREVLSLVAWILAAVAAWFALKQPALMDFASQNISNKTIATVAIAALAFFITLILVSIVSVRISDRVVDSAAGHPQQLQPQLARRKS